MQYVQIISCMATECRVLLMDILADYICMYCVVHAVFLWLLTQNYCTWLYVIFASSNNITFHPFIIKYDSTYVIVRIDTKHCIQIYMPYNKLYPRKLIENFSNQSVFYQQPASLLPAIKSASTCNKVYPKKLIENFSNQPVFYQQPASLLPVIKSASTTVGIFHTIKLP